MFKHHIIFQNFVDRLRNMRQDLIKNIQHTHTHPGSPTQILYILMNYMYSFEY